jgi:putrescine aminotransferase
MKTMIRTAKGIESELSETARNYQNHINPSLAKLMKFGGYFAQETFAEGVHIYDEKGNKYIDCAGGYGVFIVGHRHPRVVLAVKRQLDAIPLSSRIFFNKPQGDLAKQLSDLTGGNLPYSFFCNSGAEAIEGALKIARMATGRPQFVSTINSYHGKTFGALSISGREIYRAPFEPLLPENVQVPYNDLEALRNVLSERTAAFVVEPIQGEGGIMVPSDDYLAGVQKLCRDCGALLIVDEIQTGMGRTGLFFAYQRDPDLCPDLVTLAKGLGGGVMPIGAILGTPSVWKVFQKNPLIHTSTFGGNQLASVAALATIEVIREEDLLEKCRERGHYFLEKLRSIREDNPDIIAEVRGRGLMIGVEMVKESFGGSIILEMARGRITGVYTLNNQKVIRFEPPLIIDRNHIDEALEVFKTAVEKTRRALLH